jgi:hypothetical protein
MPDGKGALDPTETLESMPITQMKRRTRLRRGAPERSMRFLLRSNGRAGTQSERFFALSTTVAYRFGRSWLACCGHPFPFFLIDSQFGRGRAELVPIADLQQDPHTADVAGSRMPGPPRAFDQLFL